MRARIAAIVVGLALHSEPAGADANEDAALVHLDRGIAAFNAKDWKVAEREISTAMRLAPHKPNPYRWLALTEIQLGDCATALLNIDAFLAHVEPSDPRVAEMKRWQELCRRDAQAPPTVTGTQGLATAPAVEPETRRPLRARWWFWPVVGGAVLVATGATIYVATHDRETVLPSIHCGAQGCQ